MNLRSKVFVFFLRNLDLKVDRFVKFRSVGGIDFFKSILIDWEIRNSKFNMNVNLSS